MAEGCHWYRKAAEQGYILRQQGLAAAYHLGPKGTQDLVEADAWYIIERNDRGELVGTKQASYRFLEPEAQITRRQIGRVKARAKELQAKINATKAQK